MSGLGLRVHRTAQNLDRWVFGRYREFLDLELIVANAQSPFDWKSRHHGAIARIFSSLLKRNFVENRRFFLFEIQLFSNFGSVVSVVGSRDDVDDVGQALLSDFLRHAATKRTNLKKEHSFGLMSQGTLTLILKGEVSGGLTLLVRTRLFWKWKKNSNLFLMQPIPEK